MRLLTDESGQAGGVILFVLGIFITGFFYVAFSIVMQQVWSSNNELIANPAMAYSQEHRDTMDTMFKYWWALPIFGILLYVVWGIKNALTREPTEI